MNMMYFQAGRQMGKTWAQKGARRAIGIQELLVWAFRRECAQLDFPSEEFRASGYGYASSTARIIETEQLGCNVDGGGRSEPHPDADLVASAVAVLPESVGGRRMAISIVEWARSDSTPDWMPGATPRIYPADTHTNRHGVRAKTEDAAGLGSSGWPAQPRRNRKGVIVHDKVLYSPVIIRPGAADIARARRVYLDWYRALFELRCTFQIAGDLTAFDVTDQMPARAPWRH